MVGLRFLKPLAILIYGLAGFVVIGFSHMANAQDGPILYRPDPDSPIGTRNPNAPAELAQFDFLIGDWDVEIIWSLPGRELSKSHAKWHNHWILGGNVVMLEWRGPQFTGAELRQWDASKNKWAGVNIYPDFGPDIPQVTAEKAGDTMLVFIPYETPDGAAINRETYYDIEADDYKMKSEISTDGGQTWAPGYYQMTVTRSQK